MCAGFALFQQAKHGGLLFAIGADIFKCTDAHPQPVAACAPAKRRFADPKCLKRITTPRAIAAFVIEADVQRSGHRSTVAAKPGSYEHQAETLRTANRLEPRLAKFAKVAIARDTGTAIGAV